MLNSDGVTDKIPLVMNVKTIFKQDNLIKSVPELSKRSEQESETSFIQMNYCVLFFFLAQIKHKQKEK